MKATTLMLTAIICVISILSVNVATVFAEPLTYDLQVSRIENITEFQHLSKKVRDRNTAIGAVLGIAAIAAIANNNHKKDKAEEREKERQRYDNRDYDRGGYNGHYGSRNAPPPPPMPAPNR